MGTPALKAQSSADGATSPATIASDSYLANRLILVAIGVSKASGSAADKPGISGLGATWTERGDVSFGGSSRFRITLYSTTLASNQTGTISLTLASAHEKFLWQVVQYNDASTWVQGAVANDGGASVTTITATLAAFADPANGAFSFMMHGGSSGAVTPGTGWTELGEYSDGRTIQGQWRSDNDTTADISLAVAQRAGIIAAEIAPDPSVTGTGAFTEVNDTLAGSGSSTTGTVAYTEANDTTAASGWTTVRGTGAYTEALDTLAALGSSFQPALGAESSAPTIARVTAPRAGGYGVAIDGLWYRLAVGPNREMVISSAPLQPQKLSTSENPEDMRSEFGDYYSRVKFDGGEGLAFAHSRDNKPVDSTRFWDSHNIDISPNRPGELPSLKLLADTAKIDASTQTNLVLATDTAALYMAIAHEVRRSADPTVATPTWTTENPNLAEGNIAVGGLVGVGTTLYAALGANGIHTRIGGTWAHWSDIAASAVWAAKATSSGAIILAAGSGATANILYRAASAAGSTTLITLGAGETFIDVVDAGAAILVSASNGYIYSLGLNSAGSGLELKGQTKVADVGYASALGAAGGFVFYGLRVSSGAGAVGSLWRASLDPTSFTLKDSTVIRRWDHEGTGDHGVNHHPSTMTAARDSLFIGIDEGHGKTAGLWRYDLASGGRVRHLRSSVTSAQVVDVMSYQDRLFFSVSGSGLWREQTTYASEGWLITPAGDLFSATEKQWVGAYLDTAPVTAGTVELLYTTDPSVMVDATSTRWVSLIQVRSSSPTEEIEIRSSQGRYVIGQLKLTAGAANTVSPTPRGITFHAYPGNVEQLIRVPINVSDRIEMPNKRPINTKRLGIATYNRIKGKEGHYVELSLLSPTEVTYRGTIEKVEFPITEISEKGAPTVICWVSFRGRVAPIGGTSRSRGAFGGGTFGIIIFGGTA